MDIVFIKQLQVDTVIGVYDWEKTIKQRLVLDITLAADQRAAANNDDIRLTLDYAVITEKVIKLITAQPIELIETVAERVAQLEAAVADYRSACGSIEHFVERGDIIEAF